MLAPDPPVLMVQNNYSRLQDTAPACDILATDPYPVPNVSLRAVADATLAARRAVADRKPVWTVLFPESRSPKARPRHRAGTAAFS